MVKTAGKEHTTDSTSRQVAFRPLRDAIEGGRAWPTSLLEAMALWTSPRETYRGRTYNYFIAGEAFDWLLLAERLCEAVEGIIPQQEQEELLFSGRFPVSFDWSSFQELMGVDKYRGYLNYHYGVTVEEALQLATELEVHKRHASNGVQYLDDYSDEAHVRIYRASRSELLERFREESGYPSGPRIGLGESKEFTYWLFKYRLKVCDKTKIASDTRKGLDQLRRMKAAWAAHNSNPAVTASR